MADLGARIAAESENVERTLRDLDSAMSRQELGTVELAAIGAFVHNAYSGMENILKQILRERGHVLPGGPTWHKDLLEQAVSLRVLSRGAADELFEYLGFRHVFVHGYGFMLRAELLMPLAEKTRDAWRRFIADVGSGQ